MQEVGKYRINRDVLHKKKIKEKMLQDTLLSKWQITTGYATSVFHYTSVEGLMGILQNREIFFTDAQFLNDYTERFDINNDLKRFWDWNYRDYDKEFYILIKNININSYEDNQNKIFGGDVTDEKNRYFILSASMNQDSLSMWKYYAKNGQYNGYNIDLFIPALLDEWIDEETGVVVEDGLVIYDIMEKQAKIRCMVEKLYEFWCTYEKSETINNKIINEYRAWISYASLFFKNEYFASEQEMRFVAIVPKNRLNNLHYEKKDGTKVKMYDFRNINGVIIPYIKMPLFGWNVSENLITSSIRVGPCMDFEQRKCGILQFVDSLEYRFHEIRVKKSEIPLRY